MKRYISPPPAPGQARPLKGPSYWGWWDGTEVYSFRLPQKQLGRSLVTGRGLAEDTPPKPDPEHWA